MNDLCFLDLVVLHMHWKEELCFYLLLGCHIAICSQCALRQEVSQSVQIIITPVDIIRFTSPFFLITHTYKFAMSSRTRLMLL